MTDTDWITPDRRVCITGRGVDAMAHRHDTIKRVTKTQIVCEGDDKFRIDGLISIPYEPYGGCLVHPTCQRPKR